MGSSGVQEECPRQQEGGEDGEWGASTSGPHACLPDLDETGPRPRPILEWPQPSPEEDNWRAGPMPANQNGLFLFSPVPLTPPPPRCRPPSAPCPQGPPTKDPQQEAHPHRLSPSPFAKATSSATNIVPSPPDPPCPAPLHLGGEQDGDNLGDGRQEQREVLCRSFLVKHVLLRGRERGWECGVNGVGGRWKEGGGCSVCV